MWRWLGLIALNIFATMSLVHLRSWFDLFFPSAFLQAVLFVLCLPLGIVIHLFKPGIHLFVAAGLLAVNPIFWATMVELGLRFFVDEPKAPTQE